MNIQIKLAKKSQAKEIYNLYRGEEHLEGNSGIAYDFDNIEDYFSNKRSKFFIALIEKKIVATLFVEFYCDYAYFHTMVVRKEFRKKGISKKLLDYAESYVKKKKIFLIECMAEIGNTVVNDFLKRRDYTKGNIFQYYTKKL